MSAIGDCCNQCHPVAPPVNIPGSPGTPGTPGTNGVNAFSAIASFQGVGFTVPSVGSSATVYVTDTGEWMALNQPVFVSGAGQYLVTAAASVGPNGTSVQLKNTGASGNAIPGSTISAGNTISPSGLQGTNAYTVTTAPFTTPAVGYAGTITCANVAWMVVGETVFVQGGGYFTVSSINVVNGTALLSNPGFANTTAGANIATGSGVGPSGTQGSLPFPLASNVINLTSQSIGLTGTSAGLGGGSGILNLPSNGTGTWLVFARAVVTVQGTLSSGTTPCCNIVLSLKAIPSGGSLGPISNGQTSPPTIGAAGVQMNVTFVIPLQPVLYTSPSGSDQIQLYGNYSNSGSGFVSATVVEVQLYAICLNLQA